MKNNNIFLVLLIFSTHTTMPKSITDSISSSFTKIGDTLEKTTQDIQSTAKKVFDYSIIEKSIDFTKAALDGIVQNSKNILLGEPKPQFCTIRTNQNYAPTVSDSSVVEKDEENIIPLIKKYAPILYLCNERYYPIAAEDYFTAPNTQLVYYPDHKKSPKNQKTIVLPKGEVTMEKIYENRTKYSGKDYFFEIEKCTEFGSNPKQFSDAQGNLTTPIYVTFTKHNGKLYIVYAFIYGFNGAYPIYAPGINVPILKGDIAAEQGAHEFDIEHITVELNSDNQLERIFFAAHTKAEGVWITAKDPNLTFEGTHPVVHVATNGHGSYPRAGTHVRIFGFGNDITCKNQKWIPQLVLLYPDSDERFDPKTMGWVYHSGMYGARGVDPMSRYFDGTRDLTRGQALKNVQFCPNPKNTKSTTDWAKYRFCVETKRINATIPKAPKNK